MRKSFTFLLAMLISCVTFAQVSVWDGTYEPWTHGTGTESDPFLIENAQQLAYLAFRVNNGLDAGGGHVSNHDYHYKLMVDVDLNGSEDFQWVPIGYWNSNTEYYSFGGCFDGDNHAISNLYINSEAFRVGFFGFVDGATIQNITIGVDAITTTASNSDAGGVIGCAEGSTNVNNCNCDITNGISAISSFGGIVGRSSAINISNCNSVGSLSNAMSNGVSGGIIGTVGGVSTINNCSHSGNITATYSGGIVGTKGSGEASLTITNCKNDGSLTSSSICGGILSWGGSATIVNCYNTGNLSSSTVGGVFGQVNCDYYYGVVTVSNSYNIGDLTGINAGGIVGNKHNNYGTVNVSNCYYLNTCGGNNTFGGQPMSSDAMQSADFVAILNNGSLTFKRDEQPYLNQGYPIFSGFNIQTLPASSVAYTSAVMNGSYSSGIYNIISQGFEYKKTTDPNYTTVNCSAGQTPYAYSLSNLESGNTYHYRAFATANEGTSYGNLVEFTTPIPPVYTIIASVSGTSGTISPVGNNTVIEGESITFTITPTGQSAIQSVLVDGNDVGSVTSYTFSNVTANHTIEAVFYVPGRHQITARVLGPGIMTPSGMVSVVEGEDQTFEIAQLEQSVLDSVKVDDVNVGSVTSYTFQNVTEDHAIYAYFSMVVTPDLNPWDGMTVKEPFGCGDSYYIVSPTELAWVAQQANNGETFSGKTVHIMNDLDLGGAQSTPATWIPIGTLSSPFCGNLEGYGNSVKNLFHNNLGNSYVGLFGIAGNSTIKNLLLKDVNVTGDECVGGLSGEIYNSEISNCGVTGTINGSSKIGGLFGSVSSPMNIQDCFSIADVAAHSNLGGLVGYVRAQSSLVQLSECFSSGSILSDTDDSSVGGMIGYVYVYTSNYQYGNCFISNCYSNCSVHGTSASGFIGDINDCSYYYNNAGNVVLSNCYVTGSLNHGHAFVPHASYGYNTLTCTNCYYDSQVAGNCSNGIPGVSPKNTSEMTTNISFGMTGDNWVYTSGLYPQLPFFVNNENEAIVKASQLSVAPVFLQNDENSSEVHSGFRLSTANGVVWSSSDTDVIGVNGSNANVSPMMIAKEVTLTAALNNTFKKVDVTVAGSDTIFVYQTSELRLVAEQCNSGVTYEGKYIKLMNDIEFEFGVPNNMTQIGIYPDHPFMGTLDGNGKVIRNAYFDHPNNEYQGFFGYTLNANLYEVGLENLTISGRNYTGGLVSYAENTYIRDSYVNGGTLFALSYVGGLVGYQSPGANSVICGCYNTCEVTGNNYLGGLVGFSDHATVRNSYVIAPIIGNGNAVGAIIGRADQVLMYNCYFSIEETGQTQAIGENNLKDGDEGMHSADMKTTDFVDKLNRNLVVEVWRSDYANNINNGFPIIKWQPDYNNPCLPPINLMVNEVGSTYVKLSWQGAADNYVIAFGENGVYNQTISTSENMIRLENLRPNTDYDWKIKAVCGEYETDYVQGQSFKTQGFGVDEDGCITTSISPNPTSGKVMIKTDGLRNIYIYNSLGQLIYFSLVDEDVLEYDFGKHEAGIYLIRVETDNGVAAERVLVTK